MTGGTVPAVVDWPGPDNPEFDARPFPVLRYRIAAHPMRRRFVEWRFNVVGELVRRGTTVVRSYGAIGPNSPAGRRFGSFGPGSIICYPHDSIVAERTVHLGANVLIGPHVSISGGWFLGPDDDDRVVVIGDDCLIGRGSSIIGHVSIEIGRDVWTGHHVHITDMNHDYVDVTVPIGQQNQPPAPVRIGDGSWLGHNTVVLPGVTIGRHVVVGAGSVVTTDLPDYSVAVGSPARVIRRYDLAEGWVAAGPATATAEVVSGAF